MVQSVILYFVEVHKVHKKLQLTGRESGRLTIIQIARIISKRKLAFDLTHEEFKNLTKGNCHFCGVPPYQEYRPGHKSGSYIYNGVDRLVNEDRYTISNSVSCWGICNDMKRNRSVTEFISACEEIVNHQKRCQERPLETAP